MIIELSILVCSTTGRSQDFYPRIMKQLTEQTNGRANVEVLALTDNKIMSIGEKRNLLKKTARGRYIAFVDDDDKISDNYVSALLSKIPEGCDVIVFNAMYDCPDYRRPVVYDFSFAQDRNTEDCFYRIPNHLMCFKKEVANQQDYMHINFGEDAYYAKEIQRFIKTQSKLDEILYIYLDRPETSESRTRK